MSNPLITARGLTKVYTDFFGRPKHEALKGLDLDVQSGELFGLLGPNGSGKTTTIKLVLGLIRPTAGSVSVLGARPTEVAHRSRLGFLPEESYFYDFLSADETLDFYAKLFGMGRAERRRRADELIEMVGIGHARGRKLREYSKGMVRRVGLAQALINDPELLILDEPTSGLDPIGTREFKDLLVRLRDEGKTILLSSHLLADVQSICDRIGMLHAGEKVLEGTLDDLLALEGVSEIRWSGAGAVDEVAASIREAGGEVISSGSATESLEDLFIRKIRERQGGAPRATAPETKATAEAPPPGASA